MIAAEVAEGNSRPAGLSDERRTRLPDAGSHRSDACPAANRSGFGWPARSAAAWSACCTFSTNRRSVCTRATTIACCDTLPQLRDVGNTVFVVEHDEDTMRHSRPHHRLWPRSRRARRQGRGQGLGGRRHQGRRQRHRTVSGRQTADRDSRHNVEPMASSALRVVGAPHNNLKNDRRRDSARHIRLRDRRVGFRQELAGQRHSVEALRRDLNGGNGAPGSHERLEGLEHLDKMIAIDQSPIGRTPRSNPGTYIKVFDDIRKLFTQLPESKRRGYKPGRFSFNVDGGRCEACEGNGSNRLEMDFLADVWVTCPVCEGHRFNRETLQVKFKDKSIADVLEMDVQQGARSCSRTFPRSSTSCRRCTTSGWTI